MNIYNKLAVLARKHKGKAHTDHNTAICADCGLLCARCLVENYRLILRNTKDYAHGKVTRHQIANSGRLWPLKT